MAPQYPPMTRAQLLTHFANLPSNLEERVVIGQNMSPWRTPLDQYDRYIESVYNDTGRFPGLLSAMYGRGQTLAEMRAWNPYLTDHWNLGGFVMVSWQPNNPWTGNQPTDQSQADLSELTNPASDVYPVWRDMMDDVATALQDLEDDNVIVLWRPWCEMTFTNLFWWSANNDEVDFKAAWQDMHGYLTTTKGLSNLVWVYCVADQEPWWPEATPYPGDAYVDMTGVDIYRDNPSIRAPGYANLTNHGKPFSMPEVGPGTVLDGSFDSSIFLTNIRSTYPLTTWINFWHSWNHPDYANRVAIIHNEGRRKLMYDHWAVCRQERPNWLAHLTHESNDFSEYDTTATGGGDLSIAAGAALAGTSYGINLFIDDTDNKYAEKDITLNEDVIRVRFHLDPNGVSFAGSGDNFTVVSVWRDVGSPYNIGFVELGRTNGSYYVSATGNSDDGGSDQETAQVIISDAPHVIEMKLVRSSNETADDGTVGIRVDDSDYEVATGIDNWNIWTDIGSVRVGAVWGLDAGTSGTVYIDEVGVIDGAEHIDGSVVALMLEPDSDRSTNWNTTGGNHYGEIATGLPVPGKADESGYITVPQNSTTVLDSFTMGTVTIAGNATEITVWVHCHIFDESNFNLDISLWDAAEAVQYGSTQTVPKTPRASTIVDHNLALSEGQWREIVFTGISLSQAQLDGLVIRLDGDAGPIEDNGYTRVFGLYALVTAQSGTTTTTTATTTLTTTTYTTTTTLATTTVTTTTGTTTATTTVPYQVDDIVLGWTCVEPLPVQGYQAKGLTISVFKPTISSYTPAGIFLMNLEDEVTSYTQTLQAIGGYWDARFTIRDRLDRAEDWIDGGLGRHVETYSPELERIWEGFVNKVTLNVGGFQVVRGPLVGIANRASLVYSVMNTGLIPPSVGMRVKEGPQNDTDSQTLYGIVEKILTAGGIPASEAEDILTTYITEYALPETSKSLSTGGRSEPVVTVECLGYVHWLRLYAYSQTASTGTQNLSAKIENILDADPNSLFASSNADITSNALQVKRYENDDKTAWALIKSLVAKGDASGNRYLFGIHNARRATYEAIPTTIEYQQRLTDPAQKVETLAGTEVKPWNVRAGRWLFLPDFLIGKTQPSNLREDPRALFIESVGYTMPWSLSLNGGKVSTLPQKLAQLGLAGIGAG